jgi:hypothetical protein
MPREGLVAVTTYTAEIHRERRMWVAYVPEIGHATQGRSLKEIDYMVRDLVRLFTEDDPAEVTIVIQPDDPRLQEQLAAAQSARREAAVAADQAAERSQHAAKGLAAAGFTVRDIGALLGVTFQRAHQLVAAARRSRPT